MINEKAVSPSLNSRLMKWFAVICYGALIFYLSSLSVSPEQLPPFFMFDKVLHLVEYGILGFLLYRALREESWTGKPILLAFVIGMAYGITDEFHQYFVPTRESDPFDLLADSAGSGIGALFGSFINRGGRLE